MCPMLLAFLSQRLRMWCADIAGVAATMPKMLGDIAVWAVLIRGWLGISEELPFGKWVLEPARPPAARKTPVDRKSVG